MERERILVHSCCAPCSTAVILELAKSYDIAILFYNPNIYPEDEYQKRRDEQIRYATANNIPVIVLDYNPTEFDGRVKGLESEREGGARCAVCFKLRLEKAKQVAKEQGFKLFTTTLSVSPHKNSEIINSIGRALADDEAVFLESNFKKKDGYKKSIQLSKEFGLYRQNYCGCKYSRETD